MLLYNCQKVHIKFIYIIWFFMLLVRAVAKFWTGSQLKSNFFQYNTVICRAITRVRQGGQSPPPPLNFESSYGPACSYHLHVVDQTGENTVNNMLLVDMTK